MTFNLNEEQQDAVQTIDGPMLVLAGAGSGKTRVVTQRIAYLIESGIPASQILGLTFTNKAAKEMAERVQKTTDQYVLISTFHSLGVRILRESIHHLGFENNFNIYDQEDSLKLIRSCLNDLGIKKIDAKAIKNVISLAKNEMCRPHQLDLSSYENAEAQAMERIYDEYLKRLRDSNALDFDDLLVLTAKLFKDFPDVLQVYQDRWRYLLIDEYQDTNEAQYEIVQQLISRTENLCVVGDPDQSIYSWRGANISNILDFERDYPSAKVIRLEQNYRSHSVILEASNGLISYNTNRYEKKLWSDRGHGSKIQQYTADDERDESRFITSRMRYHHEEHHIPLNEMVIFYRTNFQSRVLEDRLLSERIPYVIVGGISFYQRREIKDILAFLRIVQSGSDFVSFGRTINLPKRGIGDTTIEKIRLGAMQENCSLFEFCEKLVEGTATMRLTGKQKTGLQDYVQLIRELRRIHDACSLMELLEEAIKLSGYQNHLMLDPESKGDRESNLGELVVKAGEWEEMEEEPTLSGFLEEISLKSSLDEADMGEDRVSLMTIHNGKGLEFSLVFLGGMEQDLFPHANSRDNPSAQEEERRLCYVGMTRAKEFLYMTHARMRHLWGSFRTQRPSQFFREIPSEYIEKIRMGHSAPRRKIPDPFINDIDQTIHDIKAPLSIGDAVMHQQFGVGVIRDIYEGSVGLTYKILFSNKNIEKSIVAQFAKLIKL